MLVRLPACIPPLANCCCTSHQPTNQPHPTHPVFMHHPKEHETSLRYFQRALQLDPTLPYAYTLAG